MRLKEVSFDKRDRTLSIEMDPQPGESYTTQFIGTRSGYDSASEARSESRVTRKYSNDIGAVLSTVSGTSASYQFTGDELYVRAMVTSSKAHTDPSFEGQKKQAWTQPYRLEK